MSNEYIGKNSAFTATANAIREKSKSTDLITWDEETGFEQAVEAISGGGLNFTVVGGTVQPENPAENTIWISTETEITGWVFDVNEPAAEIGKVWFKENDLGSCEFDMFDEGTMIVCVSDAYIFNSNEELEKVDAAIYQNGVWVTVESLGFYMFKEGSGALVEFASSGTKTITDASIYCEFGSQTKYILTSEKVDLTNYDTLCIDASNESTSTGFFRPFFVVNTDYADAPDASAVVTRIDFEPGGARQVYSLDISELSGAYHVGVSGTYTGYIFNLWAE